MPSVVRDALRVAKTLARTSTMVTYGAMSLQPSCIPNGMFIFKNLRFTGFWVNKWYDGASPEQRAETFAPLFEDGPARIAPNEGGKDLSALPRRASRHASRTHRETGGV